MTGFSFWSPPGSPPFFEFMKQKWQSYHPTRPQIKIGHCKSIIYNDLFVYGRICAGFIKSGAVIKDHISHVFSFLNNIFGVQ
jgi:glutathionyl-hydroquinone reductase